MDITMLSVSAIGKANVYIRCIQAQSHYIESDNNTAICNIIYIVYTGTLSGLWSIVFIP